MIAKDLLDRYSDLYPSAMKAFQEDLEVRWAYLRCPATHHRYIRTTNLLERAFGEQKRRTIAKHQALRENDSQVLHRKELLEADFCYPLANKPEMAWSSNDRS